jgi:hypothetical protein
MIKGEDLSANALEDIIIRLIIMATADVSCFIAI